MEPGVTATGFSPSAQQCVRLEATDVAVAQFRPVRSLLSELLALQGEAHPQHSHYEDGEDSGSECSDDTTEGAPDEDERPALVRASSSPIAIPCSEETSLYKQKENYKRMMQQRQLAAMLYQQQQQQMLAAQQQAQAARAAALAAHHAQYAGRPAAQQRPSGPAVPVH